MMSGAKTHFTGFGIGEALLAESLDSSSSSSLPVSSSLSLSLELLLPDGGGSLPLVFCTALTGVLEGGSSSL